MWHRSAWDSIQRIWHAITILLVLNTILVDAKSNKANKQHFLPCTPFVTLFHCNNRSLLCSSCITEASFTPTRIAHTSVLLAYRLSADWVTPSQNCLFSLITSTICLLFPGQEEGRQKSMFHVTSYQIIFVKNRQTHLQEVECGSIEERNWFMEPGAVCVWRL